MRGLSRKLNQIPHIRLLYQLRSAIDLQSHNPSQMLQCSISSQNQVAWPLRTEDQEWIEETSANQADLAKDRMMNLFLRFKKSLSALKRQTRKMTIQDVINHHLIITKYKN